jgi:hypothetical protein
VLSHVSGRPPTHPAAPGLHATHVPFRQAGALTVVHAPPKFCHPVDEHCCGCVPLHPYASSTHVPHAPALHAGVLPAHAAPRFCQVPVASHSCGCAGCVRLHPSVPTWHTPWHDADCVPETPASDAAPESVPPSSSLAVVPTQVWLTHVTGAVHAPPVVHVTTPLSEHAV